MPKDTKTLGNNKARACESLGFVHKKGCARVLTQPPYPSGSSSSPPSPSELPPPSLPEEPFSSFGL